MAPGQKDILPRFTIILFVMALMAIAVIAKAGSRVHYVRRTRILGRSSRPFR